MPAHHLRLAVLTLVALVPFCAGDAASPPDVDATLARFDDLYRSSASIARLELVAVTPRQTRTLRMKAWTRGEDRALVVIEAPPREAGVATLRVGEDLWNWLPRIARTIRVPPSLMLGSWMGTDFTNDDLVHETSMRKDFDSRLAGRSESPAGWTIALDVKPGAVGRWARVELVVDDAGALPLAARYYDRRGRLARTLTFDEVRAMGGRRIPTHWVLVPVSPPGNRTELRYLDVKFDADVPDDTFSLSRLEATR